MKLVTDGKAGLLHADDRAIACSIGRGGLIVAATHAPLGIDARELRIGGAA